jgi:MGT family glycosyltransferase
MASEPTLTSVPAVVDEALSAEASAGPLHRFHDESLTAGRGALPDAWGDPSKPLVYVSFGSVAGGIGDFADVYPGVLSALADEPFRVLLTTGRGLDPADLGPVPANARVERWWPQADVMPHAAVVVGHGGFGTTMSALAAGVPQVVVPLFALDQRINADHVAAVGAGVSLAGGPDAFGSLPDAVAALIDGPSYRQAARGVADEMAALTPLADIVKVVEALAR